MKEALTILFVFLFSLPAILSQSDSDNMIRDLAESVAIEIGKSNKGKIAIWQFVNTVGEDTDLGRYISEDFSIYFTNASENYQVMDRNHLNQLLKEHKLNAEGFIDPETAKELGRLKAVDAIITGTVDVLSKQLKVRIKVLDTETALQIAAQLGYIPIDDNIASFIGVPGLSSNTTSQENRNRGFNRPLNSNESYNNPGTVDSNCKEKNIGDYCFTNQLSRQIVVYLSEQQYQTYNKKIISLDPNQTQCYYDLKGQVYWYLVDYVEKERTTTYQFDNRAEKAGQINVEVCKSKTFIVK